MRPLKVDIQSLTTQKDAMLAEKTALKNEVLYNSFTVCSGLRGIKTGGTLSRFTGECHLPVVMEAPATLPTYMFLYLSLNTSL